MMVNLFSVFDPTSYFMISLNWMIVFMIFIFIPMKYYMLSSGIFIIFNKMMKELMKVFSSISFPYYLGLSYMSVMIFIYLMLSNLLGLFPFVFTSTAHPMVTMGMGVILWMCFFMMGWFKNFMNSAAHLVPEGSPLMLAPLMVLIESISHLIRPFTLSIRLAANMMAGHLIIGLISGISMMYYSGFITSIILQNILLLLEFGVAIIQGFVFSILLLLYVLEYY